MIKKIAYLTMFFSFFSIPILAIKIGLFYLTASRFLIILGILLVIISYKNNVLSIPRKMKFIIQTVILWVIYSMITILWVESFQMWIRAQFFLISGLTSIIVFTSSFKTFKDFNYMLRILLIVISVHLSIGVYEVLTGNYLFIDNILRVSAYQVNKNPTSMFYNTNDYAFFLTYSVLILLYFLKTSVLSSHKIFYSFMLTIAFVLLILTNSRASIIGLLFTVFFFLNSYVKSIKKVTITLIFILLFLAGFLIFSENFSNMFLSFIQSISLDFQSNSGSEATRINLFKNGISFTISTFGFGVGSGNTEYWLMNNPVYFSSGITSLHSWWIEILASYGILIFVLYTVSYYKLISNQIYLLKRSSQNIYYFNLLLLAILISNIFLYNGSSTIIHREWIWLFWAFIVSYQIRFLKQA